MNQTSPSDFNKRGSLQISVEPREKYLQEESERGAFQRQVKSGKYGGEKRDGYLVTLGMVTVLGYGKLSGRLGISLVVEFPSL